MRDLIEEFKHTLKISKKFFKIPDSFYYKENDKMKIVWSNNTVKSIFELKGKIAVLNFADDGIPGGLVWQGAKTQEECLCRCSNLYLSLIKHEGDYYAEDGGLIYSKDVVFFKDDEYRIRKPRMVDVISCAGLGNRGQIMRKMRMIIESAELNGVDVLVLGKWGCGAFGGNWKEFRSMWIEVLEQMEIDWSGIGDI